MLKDKIGKFCSTTSTDLTTPKLFLEEGIKWICFSMVGCYSNFWSTASNIESFPYWRKFSNFFIIRIHPLVDSPTFKFQKMLLDYNDLMKIPYFKAGIEELTDELEKLRYQVCSFLILSNLECVWYDGNHFSWKRCSWFVPLFGWRVENLLRKNVY